MWLKGRSVLSWMLAEGVLDHAVASGQSGQGRAELQEVIAFIYLFIFGTIYVHSLKMLKIKKYFLKVPWMFFMEPLMPKPFIFPSVKGVSPLVCI